MEVKIYIEGNYIDLYKDEGINFKSTVQDINDISKVFADFTKDFNVPASKNNNKFFKHYYNADITNGFDARAKKQADIYLREEIFKKGKIRLTDVVLKNDEVDSYKIQFEGDVVKIKDLLGGDKLNSLDFSSLNHTYSSDNVKQGLETSLFGGSIIYPMISPVRRFIYDSDDATTSNTTQTNIHYNASKLNNSIDYTDLKPALKIATIIDKIQETYGLDFIGSFFNRDYYTKLFMWLNKDEGYLKTISLSANNLIDFDGGSNEWIDFSTDVFTPTWDDLDPNDDFFDKFHISWTINIDNSYLSVPYNFVITRDDVEVFRNDNITGSYTGIITIHRYIGIIENNDPYRFYIETSQPIEYNVSLEQRRTQYVDFPLNTIYTTRITTASTTLAPGLIDLSYQLPDIKIYDFLVGILRMFNISLTANLDGSINFETLPDWYRQGKVFTNFEKYVDIESKRISRGKLNNEFKFSYEKPETLLAKQFLDNTGVAYGDLEASLFDESDNLLDGSKLEIKLPFENMVYERITDLVDNTPIDLQYGYAVDKELSPVVTSPILFYNNNISINGLGFKSDTNTLSELNTTINVPNHCLSLTVNELQNINFGAEFSTYNYGLMEQSLYKSFYQDYITDMFSNQRRVYNYDAIIPSHILVDINLNDRLIIGNRRYIINSINSNLITKKTKLELLNDIYTSGDLIGDSFYTDPNNLTIDGGISNNTITIYAKNSISVSIDDIGYGFFIKDEGVTSKNNIHILEIASEYNYTGFERYQLITISQSGYSDILFYITQNE